MEIESIMYSTSWKGHQKKEITELILVVEESVMFGLVKKRGVGRGREAGTSLWLEQEGNRSSGLLTAEQPSWGAKVGEAHAPGRAVYCFLSQWELSVSLRQKSYRYFMYVRSCGYDSSSSTG